MLCRNSDLVRLPRQGLLALARRAVAWGGVVGLCAVMFAAEPAPTALSPVSPSDPAWQALARQFAHHGDVAANFVEQRYFPFRREPVELTGEVRVSAEHGLSLHYRTPEQRTVIVDRTGLLLREPSGEATAPSDPRAATINDALLHILTLDLAPLEQSFDVAGRQEGGNWTLELVPKLPELRHAIERITVSGSNAVVWHIEIRHSAKQYIEIQMSQPFPARPFSADELRQYFR